MEPDLHAIDHARFLELVAEVELHRLIVVMLIERLDSHDRARLVATLDLLDKQFASPAEARTQRAIHTRKVLAKFQRLLKRKPKTQESPDR